MSGNAILTEYIPMIKEVSIENFKGIKHCEIKDIGKVNLFIGRNGCGKSSIMEAIYFTGKEFLGANLPRCIRRRANRGKWSSRELWFNYDLTSVVDINLVFNNENLTGMVVQFVPDDRRTQVLLKSGSRVYKDESIRNSYDTENFSFRSGGHATSIQSTNHEEIRIYFENSVFIDPTIKRDTRHIEATYLNRIELSEESRQELAKRIAEIYETEPDWGFLPHQDFPPTDPSRFTIFEGKRRLYLDNFGDGLHYGLAVLAVARTRKNTVLFIEEIESHQHPEAIRNLVSNLLDIARANNLQLFITTHNQSVWNYLYYHYESPEERRKEFRCFHVIRDKDSGKVDARIEEGIVNIQPDLHGTPA